MNFRYSAVPLEWQTLYTRDHAYRNFGRYARHYQYVFFAGLFVVAGYIAARAAPTLTQFVSSSLGASIETLAAAISLAAFLLALLLAFVALSLVRSRAYQAATAFFADFHQPSEGIDPAVVIQYRLNGKFRLPHPFTPLFQFRYLMVRDGGIVKPDEWPAWMARTLGGPLLLIIYDGYALYLERGNRFSRVVGPGERIPFLEWYETIRYVVDLRPKVREDHVRAWTKDGIRIDLTIRLECRIGDPQKKDPEGKLIFPFDPLAVKKAVERFAVRWPTCPEEEPEEFTWTDAAWGQVTSVVPDYIGSRKFDELFAADNQPGPIQSKEFDAEIKFALNELTRAFGVYIIDFQVTKVEIPPEVEHYQKEYWKAEKQGHMTRIDGTTKAYSIEQIEKTRANAQRDIIVAIAKGLQQNNTGQFTEPVLLSLSRVLDRSLRDPLTRAYLAQESLGALEQLQKYLNDQHNAER
ncbi:MAG: hypothetical protein HFACDABA_01947 [Anaerolineales bacterium]|nr:hypothetical protein [Anaerolineales bacterium]